MLIIIIVVVVLVVVLVVVVKVSACKRKADIVYNLGMKRQKSIYIALFIISA